MIRQIAPQFFTRDLPATLAYYRDSLGFECVGTWDDPPVYAIVARDGNRIHFRFADPPIPNPDKYADELPRPYRGVGWLERATAARLTASERGASAPRTNSAPRSGSMPCRHRLPPGHCG